MGLSNFPSPADGILPLVVMNTVMSVAIVKNAFRSMLRVFGVITEDSTFMEDLEYESAYFKEEAKARRVSVTRYRPRSSSGEGGVCECCVCLCGFKAEEEVSELSCKHFFHKGCLDRWFGNFHVSCPICRSVS